MFSKLKNLLVGNKTKQLKIMSPLSGELVSISEVDDPTFAEEMLGRSVAIRPMGGRVVSPINGVVDNVFDTGHAVTLISDSGVEVLIHVGLEKIVHMGFRVIFPSSDRVFPHFNFTQIYS